MVKGVVLALVLIGFSVAGAPAQVPVGAPWDTSTLSQAGFAGLVEALHTLEGLVNDPTMGPQKTFGEAGWTSLSFAHYAGGALSSAGYQVLIATGGEWPGADHSWVLVLLETPTVSAWVPVEATPQAGQAQLSLGHVAVAAISEAMVAFDGRYAAYARAEELPSNVAPTAGLRVSTLHMMVDTPFSMFSFLSNDPDGEIVLYRWRIGSGPWFATTSPSASGTPVELGSYSITLQVVDNLGASSVASVNIKVSEKEPDSRPLIEAGCGCGG